MTFTILFSCTIVFAGKKNDNDANRRAYSKASGGNAGRENISKTDLAQFYPGTMHYGLRASETIAKRVMQVKKNK